MNKIFHLVCEGKSEMAYLKELNRFLRENNYLCSFSIEIAGSGFYRDVKKAIKIKKEKERKIDRIIVWIDKDIYLRGDDTLPKFIPSCIDIKFSYMNYEDFLTLHDLIWLKKWTSICQSYNHFITPMHRNVYEPLFKSNICNNYKKGDMPFEINDNRLNQLFLNNESGIRNNQIHSDIVDFVKEVIDTNHNL